MSASHSPSNYASPSCSPSPPDIAAAMGFASFGAKPNPPKKKRKIAGTEPDHEGSGSNNTPLGMRAKDKSWRKREEGQERMVVKLGKGEVGGGKGVDGIGRGEGSIDPVNGEEGQELSTISRNLEGRFVQEGAWDRGLKGLEQMGRGGGEGRRADGEWDWGALRRGVRDERGDMAFYDASFVEDPWRDLLVGRGGESTARPG